MSVAKRAIPASIISFRVSIHVSRILSPSFFWHGSLKQRLLCNDQFSVPDSLQSHTNTFVHTGRTAAPASHTARVINKSSTQHLQGMDLDKTSKWAPGPDRSASRGCTQNCWAWSHSSSHTFSVHPLWQSWECQLPFLNCSTIVILIVFATRKSI